LQQLQLVEVDAGQTNDVITTLEMGILSTVSSRHVLHRLQLVEVDAGQANGVTSTKERQGFCLQFMEAETVHESKQGCEWQSPEG